MSTKTPHRYLSLDARWVGSYQSLHLQQEDGTYNLSIAKITAGEDEMLRKGLTRLQLLIYLAMMGRLPYVSYFEEMVEAADIMCDKARDETVFGVRLEIFYNPDETWSLEIEPGVGTTVARMTFESMDGACEALMGLLCMLSTRAGSSVPYLKRV